MEVDQISIVDNQNRNKYFVILNPNFIILISRLLMFAQRIQLGDYARIGATSHARAFFVFFSKASLSEARFSCNLSPLRHDRNLTAHIQIN